MDTSHTDPRATDASRRLRRIVVAVPVAAYTGWNPRRPISQLPTPLYEFLGSMLPLLTGPTPLEWSGYEAAVRAAAKQLVADRFLLSSDVESTVSEALEIYRRIQPRPIRG